MEQIENAGFEKKILPKDNLLGAGLLISGFLSGAYKMTVAWEASQSETACWLWQR